MHRFLQVCFLAVALKIGIPPIQAKEGAFNFQELCRRAQVLASIDYKPPARVPDSLSALDYDEFRKILFNTRNEIWKNLPFALQFMHPGGLFQDRVTIHELDRRSVRTVPFSKQFYLYTGRLKSSEVDESALDFAGFRMLHQKTPGDYEEFISFLGASYFRATGEGESFGLSARGLALNAVPPSGEEFPAFREFWIERPGKHSHQAKIYALLDSPSVTGAYEFSVRPGAETVMHVKARVFARREGQTVGLAPLTSMFWYGGVNRDAPLSKNRPAVHDSDGLLIHNAKDEWIWHPFSNPPEARVNWFTDDHLRGFGLVQRDRNPEDYRDKEARYEFRPTCWVEPVGNWGKGSVRLLELPTTNEFTDNVVAVWSPAEPLESGRTIEFEYNLRWSSMEPAPRGLLITKSTTVRANYENHRIQFRLNFVSDKRVTSESSDIKTEVKAAGIDVANVVTNKTKNGWAVAFEMDIPSRDTELTCTIDDHSEAISEKWHYNLKP